MKTSNILIVVLLTIISLSLVVVLLVHVEPKIETAENSSFTKVNLADIKYVVINGKGATIISSSKSSVNYANIDGADSVYLKRILQVKGDSLLIQNDDYKTTVELNLNHIQVIYASNAKLDFNDFSQDSLSFVTQASQLYFKQKIKIRTVRILAEATKFDMGSQTSIDSIFVSLNHSELKANSSIKRITGVLQDRSKLKCANVEEVQVKLQNNSSVEGD